MVPVVSVVASASVVCTPIPGSRSSGSNASGAAKSKQYSTGGDEPNDV